MATELETYLNRILSEKEEKIIPENIKKDVTIFGVKGTLEPGSSTEDLQEQLGNQDLIIQQLREELSGKASGGEVKPNVFMQEDEPVTKNGIWLKGNYQVDNIIADKDKAYEKEEWNTTKMSSLKAIPYSFYIGSAVSIGTNVYLFGGKGGNTTAYKYDTLTDTYTQLTDIPFPFAAGSAVAIDTNVYLFGSVEGGGANGNKAYKYDTLTDTYTQLKNIPYEVYYSAVVVVEGDIYLFGASHSYYFTYAYRYNVATNTYTRLTDIPYDFYYGAATSVGTDIYLFGGDGSKTTAYKYDTLTNTYTQLANIPYNFRSGSVISIGQSIYLFGSSESSCLRYAYRYNISENTYTKLVDMSYDFYFGSVVFNGTEIYLFGGTPNPTKIQILTIEPTFYGYNTVVISQSSTKNKTIIAYFGIQNAKFYYDSVFYQDENGTLLGTIPTYNGNGTEWVKISGGE